MKKTRSKLDDEFFKAFKNPSKMLLFLVWGFISFPLLNLSYGINNVVSIFLRSILVLNIYFLTSGAASAFLIHWSKKMKLKNSGFEDYILDYANKFLKIVLSTISVLIVLKLWGVDVSGFVAGVGLISVILGLALKDTIGNVFSGLSMVLDNSIRVGDYVKIETGEVGVVHELGLRSIKMVTRDNELVIIPNTRLAEMKIINYARPVNVIRLKNEFGVSYGTDVSDVIDKVSQNLKSVGLVLKTPEPNVRMKKMNRSSLDFIAYYWINNYELAENAQNTVNEVIHKTLVDNGFNIPFPQMDLHIKDIKKK